MYPLRSRVSSTLVMVPVVMCMWAPTVPVGIGAPFPRYGQCVQCGMGQAMTTCHRGDQCLGQATDLFEFPE